MNHARKKNQTSILESYFYQRKLNSKKDIVRLICME